MSYWSDLAGEDDNYTNTGPEQWTQGLIWRSETKEASHASVEALTRKEGGAEPKGDRWHVPYRQDGSLERQSSLLPELDA